LHSVFTQMSEINLKDKDVFPQACIDLFFCDKPRYFILLENKTCLSEGPSPGFSSRGAKNQEGPKTRKGGRTFKILYWMYAATKGPNVKWGAQISNGEPGTTGRSAGDRPA